MIQVQVQFIDTVAIVLIAQTVQVPQVQVVEKDSCSSTGAVCGQGRCCASCDAKRGAQRSRKFRGSSGCSKRHQVDKVVNILDV